MDLSINGSIQIEGEDLICILITSTKDVTATLWVDGVPVWERQVGPSAENQFTKFQHPAGRMGVKVDAKLMFHDGDYEDFYEHHVFPALSHEFEFIEYLKIGV